MISFFVHGIPKPKGSTRSFVVKGGGKDGGDKVVTTAANKGTKPWQQEVAGAALAAGVVHGNTVVKLVFFFHRPKSVSAKKRPGMCVKPDLDKLVRAVLDGLTGIAWHDDCEVLFLSAHKHYCQGADELPGAEITLE